MTSLQEETAAMRVLAYVCASDSVDEYFRIVASTTDKSLRDVAKDIIENFVYE